jgi:antitoxin component YwqK of YwqJK toxin-antitoxin module
MESHNILAHSEVFDESGKIISKFVSRDASGWIPHGRYTALREGGGRLFEITYREGVPHGRYVDFWSNGKVACEGQYQEAKRDGVWHFYYDDGSLMEIIHFKEDKEISVT